LPGWFFGAAALWTGQASVYAGASLAASIMAARKHGWETLPYLPAVFSAYHFSYGAGFLAGLFRFYSRPGLDVYSESVFTRITR
jgi:hypothetical protein